MAFTITINGVDRTSLVRYRSLVIEKEGPLETLRLQVLTQDITAGAYRPAEGDAIRVSQDGSLEFGGEIVRVRDAMLDGGRGGGTVTTIEARGWMFEAQDLVVWAAFPSQGVLVTAEALRTTYLAAKGWTNLAATTGGPVLPALSYAKQSVAAIFDDLTKRSGYPWRVNGDRQFAFVLPGSLVSPVTLNDTAPSKVLLGMTWERDRTRRATRLFVTTGGSGTVLHGETYTADGTQTCFPVNVLPNQQAGTVRVAAAIAATSLALSGLRASATLKAGDTFTVAAHGTTYTVASDVATDGNGDVTVAFTPGLSAAAAESDAVTFDVGTFVQLEVNGVPTALTGGAWSFVEAEGTLVKTGGAPTAGTTVKYIAPITFPATVRVWDATARNANGTWNYATVRDAEVQASEQTDLAQAKSWGDAELANRLSTPKRLKLSTFQQGLYPWMRQAVSFANRQVTGNYLIQRVVITDVGLRTKKPRVDLELLEGDAIGRDWTAWFKERKGATVGGSVAVGVGGGGTGTGGGTGSAAPFIGYGIPLGGANVQTLALTTSWQDVGEANPMPHPADPSGTWTLRVYAYQLAAGTMEVRLLVGGVEVALVSTTATGSYVDVSFFGSALTDTYTGPAAVGQCLLQARVTSGSRRGVVGQCHTVKTA